MLIQYSYGVYFLKPHVKKILSFWISMQYIPIEKQKQLLKVFVSCLVGITPRLMCDNVRVLLLPSFFWLYPSKKGPLRHYQYWAAYVYKSTNILHTCGHRVTVLMCKVSTSYRLNQLPSYSLRETHIGSLLHSCKLGRLICQCHYIHKYITLWLCYIYWALKIGCWIFGLFVS